MSTKRRPGNTGTAIPATVTVEGTDAPVVETATIEGTEGQALEAETSTTGEDAAPTPILGGEGVSATVETTATDAAPTITEETGSTEGETTAETTSTDAAPAITEETDSDETGEETGEDAEEESEELSEDDKTFLNSSIFVSVWNGNLREYFGLKLVSDIIKIVTENDLPYKYVAVEQAFIKERIVKLAGISSETKKLVVTSK